MPAAAGGRETAPEALRIRAAVPADLEAISAVEAACFPPEQAASREDLRRRLAAYPDHVLVAETAGRVAGHVMGPVIAGPYIADEMFADTRCHDLSAPCQAVFSLAVLPELRGRGIGRRLMGAMADLARREGRRAVTLTCLEEKVAFYAALGFRDHGVGSSVHGGVPWHDMVLELERP